MKSKYGCINRNWKMTIPTDMSMWAGEISQGPMAQMKSHKELMGAER